MAVLASTTRRAFLKSAPAAAIVAVTPMTAQAVETPQTAEEAIESALVALETAMNRLHGGDCQIIRNEYRFVSVLEPVRPRIVEFAGPGLYVVEEGKREPIYFVERWPDFDCLRGGRGFKLSRQGIAGQPLYYHERRPFYVYEHHLRTILIRKV